MGGLEAQLGGMGTAFASSLLGLAGSLVVGLLELFASHGQNRFFRELEDWLSTITRVGLGSAEGESGGIDHGAVATVLDQMLEQMNGLQQIFLQADAGRSAVETRLESLTESVERLTHRLEAGATSEATVMTRLADGQERLIDALEKQSANEHVDAESRMRLRSIDVQLLRVLEEMASGRQEALQELRSDLGALVRAVRELAVGPDRPRS
jgi:hypothetical protein